MKCIFTLLALATSMHGVSQTTIIMKRTNNSILLAADTRYRDIQVGKIGNKNIKKVTTDTMRKIGGSKKIYFTIAGFLYKDMFRIADSASKKSKNVNEAINFFYENVQSIALEKIEKIREVSMSEYEQNFKNKEFIAVWFAAVENNIPYFIEIKLRLQENVEGVKITYVLLRVPDPEYIDIKYRATGHISAIQDSVALDKTWENKDAVATAVRLIKKQARATPEFVSAPVDVLILTSKGAILKRYN